MRITIVAVGTRGDVQPLLALGIGLRKAGHEVRFATEESYRDRVVGAGHDYHRMSGESESFSAARAASLFRDTIEKPVTRYKRFWRMFVGPTADQHLRESLAPCVGADVVLCQPWFGIGPSLREALGIPVIVTGVFPVPALPTADFPFPLNSGARADLGKRENLRSWRRAVPVLRVGDDVLQSWRRDVLGLPALTFQEHLRRTQAMPHLLGYSPTILPKASEWGADVRVVGYWFLDSDDEYRPPDALSDFLAAGEPPVVIGFGSHVGRNPRKLTALVASALAQSGQRGVIVSGWGGLEDPGGLSGVHFVKQVPYGWLLPRAKALVHHGGAGTTSIALATGTPQITVPFGWDQAFWGYRCAALGVGLGPFAAARLTPESLASAIATVCGDSGFAQRAERIASSVRQERGVETAIAAIESIASSRMTSGERA
ncbi:MAG: glycosyltransferase [Pseudomonadota bacterium]